MTKLQSSFIVACLSLLVAGPALAEREEDREAIHALMWKYARALDTWNADAYAALYTDDGQFGVGPSATKGREALRNMIAGFTSGDAPASLVAVGVGVDELVKVDGEWLIQVRNTTADQ